jgi:DNA-directed RNA polymerase subunit alpha
MSDAAAVLDREVRDESTALKYLAQGKQHEAQGNRVQAIAAYEAAFTADPDNTDVCFRLAYNLDLVGEEDEALHLYEECVKREKPPLNALVNLSVMYEDRGKYAQAERCMRQVLATDPNHPRARLYIKDILASKQMVVEDEPEARIDRNNPLLETPVTDFELTVRTRNALRKMNIRTLADLLRMSEAELRGMKNFGDASLEEIKAMLAQRGLRLGQLADQRGDANKQRVYDQIKREAGSDDATLNRSVNEMNLSVRARKALALLSIQTIGDLCLRTEPELMGVKNFGMTSLMEIKAKLAEMGLALRTMEG